MLKRIVHRLLRRRHFWREAGFDELSELYTSMMLRSLALSLAGIFVPIYLLQLGYGLSGVLLFYACMFTARIGWDFVAGRIVARIGPKHSIIIAYGLQIIALLLLILLEHVTLPLPFISLVLGAANSIFFVAFHTDFSKVKHNEHGGKEVSFMNIMERAGATLGPLAGGVVAAVFGAQYTFFIAVLLFIAGLIPLFLTGEPVRTHQQLDYTDLPVHDLKRDFISYGALGVENSICIMIWPVFMTLFIFGGSPYATVGLIISIAVFISIVAARAVGKLIDNYKGRTLLRYGALGNAVLHLVRPWAGSFAGALAVNITNEIVTVAYRIPYTKGMYDSADQLPGHRIVYIVAMEAMGNVAKATAWGLLYLLSTGLPPRPVLYCAFGLASLASCLITMERFAALKPQAKT